MAIKSSKDYDLNTIPLILKQVVDKSNLLPDLLTSVVYSSQHNGAATAYLWQSGVTASGTMTGADGSDGNASYHHLQVGTDTVDASAVTKVNGFSMFQGVDAGSKGGRTAILGQVSVKGLPAADPAPSGYVGTQGLASANVNIGGVTGPLSGYKGTLFAGNANAFLSSGATFWNLVTACEFDVAVKTGASVGRKEGILITQTSTDAVRGTYSDAAIMINNQDGAAVGWHYGLSFGGYSSLWPFAADSTLITVQQRQVPSTNTPIALYGIDFSALTLAAGGAPFVAPFKTPASSSDTGKAGSICWDTGFIYICTATNTWKRVALSTF